MKVKLLKKLRLIGRNQIWIMSVTKSDGYVTGMSYSYSDDVYKGLFSWGDTKNDVEIKACNIYLQQNINKIRVKYRKYSINK